MFPPQELELAKSLVAVLRSEKYKDRNYLFLDPFDLTQVPGYLDVVHKPLDLRTVASNLDAGQYDSMDTFMADLNLIFQNAIKYHSGRETKWIAKMAKEMLKIVQREKSRLENPQQKKTSLKLKLGKQLPKAAGSANNPTASAVDTAEPQSVPSNDDANPPSATTKKPKLKIKMPTARSSAPPPKAIKAKPTQPKLKLKLSLNKAKPPTPTPSAPAPAPSPTHSHSPSTVPPPVQSSPSEEKVEKKKTKNSKKDKTKDKTPKESKEKKKDLKLSVKANTASGAAGGSRGKELPKGVAAPPASAVSTPKSSSALPKTPTGTGPSTTKTAAVGSDQTKQRKSKSQTKSQTKPQAKPQVKHKKTPMSPFLYRQCHKVILGLRRRLQKDISWFEKPVTDKNIVQDYRAKIKHPMDFSKITNKLENKSYNSMLEFVLDVRRICANCLRYNTSTKDTIRHSAMKVLECSEDLMAVFLTKPDCPPYPRLLYCWKLCVNVLDTLCNIVNPEDKQPTVLYFLHPVDVLYGGQFPPGYLDKVTKPMDFGTVVSNLVEGVYENLSEFSSDCRLVIQNTKTFYGDKADSKVYVDQAERLDQVLSQQLDQLARYDKSSKAQSDRQSADIPDVPMPKPPVQLLSSLMDDLRALKYTDNGTKITEPAMGPFEKPVSIVSYPDYLQHVSEPMDLSTVDKRIRSGFYETPEDFEYDMTLVFRNCEIYNSKRNGDHFVKMAKSATRQFRRIFAAKIKALEEPALAPLPVESGEEPLAKKAKITQLMPASGTSKGKAAPRITLSSAAVNAAARASNKSPRPPSAASQKKPGKPAASNQPLPLHIAISRVKEAFPLRRAVKNLQAMEADLAKYLKDLMRHPWLSAARPKFIFHVPVTMLFPELKDAYAAKIRKPMDLTTVECTLLAGNRYTSPEDLLQDVALTFSNAIKFNKEGRDIGDPASCAYYDASVHLLRYARWLSLEQLSTYVEDSDHIDEPGPDGLPPSQWKLTTANLARAREEQKAIVLDETIERSLEGDRWTWHEAECEKLLKALRHQSDNKHMKFFVHSDYPPNYTAFIAKPMDWEKVQKKLRKRQYEKFGEIIADLRLIFENAKKYNGRFTDPTSQAAYHAAVHMAEKLESAIRRLMLSVTDRIERERIDHANAEREEEALEQAEEARIRAQWKKEHEGDETVPPLPSRAETLQKIRVRNTATRREDADFEIPFFDDENLGQHERSYFEVIKFQKSMFEKQRQEMTKMRSMAAVLGGSFYARMRQRAAAQEWLELEKKKRGIGSSSEMEVDLDSGEKNDKEAAEIKPSAVLELLEKKDRQQLKLSVAPAKKRPKKRPLFTFE